MVSAMKCLLAVVLVASFACSAYAVQCYQCESLTNPKCGENFEAEDSMKFDCARIAPPRFLQSFIPTRNATGCMKKVMEYSQGHPQIVRSCYFGEISHTNTGCQSDPSLPFVKQLACDVCEGNLCNSSTVTGPMAAAIALFFALARMMS